MKIGAAIRTTASRGIPRAARPWLAIAGIQAQAFGLLMVRVVGLRAASTMFAVIGFLALIVMLGGFGVGMGLMVVKFTQFGTKAPCEPTPFHLDSIVQFASATPGFSWMRAAMRCDSTWAGLAPMVWLLACSLFMVVCFMFLACSKGLGTLAPALQKKEAATQATLAQHRAQIEAQALRHEMERVARREEPAAENFDFAKSPGREEPPIRSASRARRL